MSRCWRAPFASVSSLFAQAPHYAQNWSARRPSCERSRTSRPAQRTAHGARGLVGGPLADGRIAHPSKRPALSLLWASGRASRRSLCCRPERRPQLWRRCPARRAETLTSVPERQPRRAASIPAAASEIDLGPGVRLLSSWSVARRRRGGPVAAQAPVEFPGAVRLDQLGITAQAVAVDQDLREGAATEPRDGGATRLLLEPPAAQKITLEVRVRLAVMRPALALRG